MEHLNPKPSALNHNFGTSLINSVISYPSSNPETRQVFLTTEGPMWGHPMPVLGALSPFLEPFCGHLSPKLDKVS